MRYLGGGDQLWTDSSCQRRLYKLTSDFNPTKKELLTALNRIEICAGYKYKYNTIQGRGSETQKFGNERVDEGKITTEVCKENPKNLVEH